MRQLQKWTTIIVMTLVSVSSGLAATSADATTAAQPLSPDAILGFENLAGWQVAVTGPTAQLNLTPVRTQGSSAFSVTSPGNSLRLTSMPVSSDASKLVGLAAPGATLAVDVRFPVGRQSSNTGSIRLSVVSV